jgi:hypothetical protein
MMQVGASSQGSTPVTEPLPEVREKPACPPAECRVSQIATDQFSAMPAPKPQNSYDFTVDPSDLDESREFAMLDMDADLGNPFAKAILKRHYGV